VQKELLRTTIQQFSCFLKLRCDGLKDENSSLQDDICENCGAVLQTLSPTAPTGITPTASSAASPSVSRNSVTFCPNCKQPVSLDDDICENCGVVLAPFVTPIAVATNSTPTQETCPQCHTPRVPGVKFCTPENKRRAVQSLQNVYASSGTRMSTALDAIVGKMGQDRTRATKILFLTDGKNEGEKRVVLNQAVTRCATANISISAWGVGTDWDAAELRYIADATHGSADIIPTPQQIAPAFSAAFSEMRKTAITNTSLTLWSPVGVAIKHIQQVYPSIAPLDMQLDAANPHQRMVALGSFAAGEQHEYLCDLEIPIYTPGQQFLMLRPSIKYVLAKTGEQEEKSTRAGWVFAQWTEDMNLAAQLEPHIAHYTHQEELSQRINYGQAALAAGERDRATRLLGEALEISERTGNERMTKLLQTIVLRDAKGTIRLNQQADAVAKKTLAINVGRTTKLK
jgi:Ca-activated chloride channel family protein